LRKRTFPEIAMLFSLDVIPSELEETFPAVLPFSRLINQTRGLLSEYGLVSPFGRSAFCRILRKVTVPNAQVLSPMIKTQLNAAADRYYDLTGSIQEVTQTLAHIAHHHPCRQLLLRFPGIGVINAMAIFSAIGSGSQLKNGSEFSAWQGFTGRHSP